MTVALLFTPSIDVQLPRAPHLSARCNKRPARNAARMVLDDAGIHHRLGISQLWAEGSSPNSHVEDPLPAKELFLSLNDAQNDAQNDIAVIGDGTPGTAEILPWDTTTGAHGVSYLGRRMVFLRKRQQILRRSYEECRRITALFSKTFYMGTSFLSPEKRRAVWAIYTWCRRTDDLVDGPRAHSRSAQLRTVLEEWEERLYDVFERRVGRDALDLALVDVVNTFPNLTAKPFADMITGMVMDIEQSRYETFDDLYLYCYRVAGTVGLMTLPIMGALKPGRQGLREASGPALALGIGFQLTNILRDVGEDRLRGRIYLPLEDLKRFNYTEEDLFNCVIDARYKALMRMQIERARYYFKKAESGIEMLSPDSRLPVRASLDMYSKILDVIEENDYDNFHKRAYLSKMGKLATVPLSFARIQHASHWKVVTKFLEFLSGGTQFAT